MLENSVDKPNFRKKAVERSGVCSAVYGTVHYKAPLKSFDKSRE